MTISDMYSIEDIVIDLEMALQISGTDYAERDFDKIMSNVRNRILRQYNVNLLKNKITDPCMFEGKNRNSVVLFIESIADMHAKLCGYLEIVRYTHEVTIKPVNVNYLGFDETKLMSVLRLAQSKEYIPSIEPNFESIKQQVGTINSCMEKKMFLIMCVAHELGFDELLASIAEILYLGGKV